MIRNVDDLLLLLGIEKGRGRKKKRKGVEAVLSLRRLSFPRDRERSGSGRSDFLNYTGDRCNTKRLCLRRSLARRARSSFIIGTSKPCRFRRRQADRQRGEADAGVVCGGKAIAPSPIVYTAGLSMKTPTDRFCHFLRNARQGH